MSNATAPQVTTDLTVASTIRQQIGNRALAMIGARNFVGSNDSLAFSIMGTKKGNKLKVTLVGDLYTVELFKLRGVECPLKDSAEMVYAEQLTTVIERMTGLAVSL